jgi:hypothetical protein
VGRLICVILVLGLAVAAGLGTEALAQPLSIYELQHTTAPDGSSDYAGQIIDCAGGIVALKFDGYRPRIVLYDPAHPDGWGAIQVKDWSIGAAELFDQVSLGDWVELTGVEVEEFRGTTTLHWYSYNSPGFNRVSQDNDLPEPLVLTAAAIPAPLPDGDPPTGWYVESHAAEPYESMFVSLAQVTVGEKGFGKADDNYELIQGGNKAWGADYMNIDAGGPYDPRIVTGARLARITGLLEQYTNLDAGWDYYQLVTRSADDVVPLEPVPTVSQWGMASALLLTMVAGTLVFTRTGTRQAVRIPSPARSYGRRGENRPDVAPRPECGPGPSG